MCLQFVQTFRMSIYLDTLHRFSDLALATSASMCFMEKDCMLTPKLGFHINARPLAHFIPSPSQSIATMFDNPFIFLNIFIPLAFFLVSIRKMRLGLCLWMSFLRALLPAGSRACSSASWVSLLCLARLRSSLHRFYASHYMCLHHLASHYVHFHEILQVSLLLV